MKLKFLKKPAVILVPFLIVLFSFQNCANQFKSNQIEYLSLQKLLDIKISDEISYSNLVSSADLIYWSEASHSTKNISQFFGEDFSVVAVTQSNFRGPLVELNSGVNQEVARLSLLNSGFEALHMTEVDRLYSAQAVAPIERDLIVVAAQFSHAAQSLRMIVNGIQAPLQTNATGQVADFSYLQKNLVIEPSVIEVMVFNRKLSSYELAVLSRQIARIRNISYVAVDYNITVNSDLDFSNERDEFKAFRQVLTGSSCFNCHSSWSSFSESDFVNSKLVIAKNLTDSLIWTRLSGTPEQPPNSLQKNMPMYLPALTQVDTDVIKKWIETL